MDKLHADLCTDGGFCIQAEFSVMMMNLSRKLALKPPTQILILA